MLKGTVIGFLKEKAWQSRFQFDHWSMDLPIRSWSPVTTSSPKIGLNTGWIVALNFFLDGRGELVKILKAFWKMYEVEHPTHEVFSVHKDNLHNVVPLLIHGDEGRAVKKTNYLVVSIESIFGSQDDARIRAGCNCESFMASRPDLPIYGGPKHTVEKKFIDTGKKQYHELQGAFLPVSLANFWPWWLDLQEAPTSCKHSPWRVGHQHDRLVWEWRFGPKWPKSFWSSRRYQRWL